MALPASSTIKLPSEHYESCWADELKSDIDSAEIAEAEQMVQFSSDSPIQLALTNFSAMPVRLR
jgi:hypothetical protein